MRVAVIGAGIIGVTTAYELAADGHQVTVFEQAAAVAGGASFAHAGLVAPGLAAPWAAPGQRWQLVRHLFGARAPLQIQGLAGLRMAPWVWRWWRACRPAEHQANRSRMHRLARYSQQRLDHLTAELKLDHERSTGVTVLLRSEDDLRRARAGIKMLSELGVPFELRDGARTRELEPALNPDMPLRAAIHLPQDGVGNCREFALLLKAQAQRLGAQFRFQHSVQSVQPGAPATVAWGGGSSTFDQVIVCAGPASGALLAPMGLRLPIAPVWGYSLTAPLRQFDGHGDVGPRSAIMDARHRVAIARLGRRVRVSGGGEIGGRADEVPAAALAPLYQVLHDWFPGAAQTAQVQRWKGARPMLPDGPPVIGPAGRPGVWLNLGHGASGWALAAGSARLLADLLAQRTPAIDTDGLGIDRLV